MRLIWKLVGWCMYIACFIKSCSITCLFAPVWWKCFCYISLGCSIVPIQSGWLRWEKRVKYSVETNIDLVTPERHLVWNCFLPLLLSACNTSLLLWLEVSRAYHMRAFLLIFFSYSFQSFVQNNAIFLILIWRSYEILRIEWGATGNKFPSYRWTICFFPVLMMLCQSIPIFV